MSPALVRTVLTAECLLHVNLAAAESFVIDQRFLPSFPGAPGEFAATVQRLASEIFHPGAGGSDDFFSRTAV